MKLLYSALLGALMIQGAEAAPTFVSVAGDLSNVSSSSVPFASTGSNSSDGLWRRRDTFGEGGVTILEAWDSGEDAPVLNMTISGLTAGATYHVDVNYIRFGYDANATPIPGSARAGIRASLDGGSTFTTFLAEGGTPGTVGYAELTGFQNSDRVGLRGYLGTAVADGGGNIVLTIDDDGNGGLGTERVWFDGASYELTSGGPGGNAAPVFISDPIAGADATEDSAYTGTLSGTATDADDDPITYAKVDGPAWLSVAGDGALRGTPTNADVGANSFTVSVTDGIIATPVEATLNLTVDPFTPPSGIVYVDAVEGSAGNTFATGSTLSDTGWINPDTGSGGDDDQWKKRVFANDGTVFQSNVGSVGLQAELTTRLTGLPDGGYEVWVFFWDAASNNRWNISAGLNSGSLSTYSFDGLGDTTSPVAASTLSYDPANAPGLTAEADRILYGVNLGEVVVADGSALEVFVNGLTTGSDNRTWYDGIGYKAVVDTDGDGLSDDYEQRIIDADPDDGVTGFADVMGTGAVPAVTDFDNDGSNDAEEAANGTDPLDPDSDDDTLPDGVETNTGVYVSASDTGTDPLNPDTDADGLPDHVETNTGSLVDAGDTGTNPLDPDSDGDGLGDGFEVAGSTDPNDATDPYSFPPGEPIQLAPDGVWTWFNDERSIWHLGKLYTGYVKKNGKVGISRFDPATLAATHTELSGFTQIDDHNNPSITILPDNRLMVVYSLHNGSGYRRLSNVTEPASIGDWGGELSTNGTSYANTYRLTGEADRIHHFNRSINWNPTMHISDDDGATFGPQIHFIATGGGGTRPYPKYYSNGVDRIDLIYTDGHPRDVNNRIYHLYYQGGNFHRTDGAVAKAVADLPLRHDSGERGTEVYTYSSAAWGPADGPDDWIPNARGWTWDICYSSNGNPVCVFQVQVDNVTGSGWNHDRIYYYYARWTGTGWQRRFIAHGGRGIYSSEDDYGGGMAIDPDNPNVIYISTNAADPFDLGDLSDVPLATDDRYEIWQGTTADGGLTFSWQPVTVGSASDNLRPIVPANHGYDRSVVWFRGDYNSYTNYDTEVVGIFQNGLRLLDSDLVPGGISMNWASSPGKTYRITGSDDLQGFPFEAAVDIGSQGAATGHSFPIPAPLDGAPRAFFRIEEQ